MPNYFTVKQASQILGFSTNSIYKFVKNGRLNSIRGNSLRGRFRITKKALENFAGETISDDHILSVLQLEPPKTQVVRDVGLHHSVTSHQSPVTSAPIPPRITRGLIILSLIFIIADILISQNFSLLQQLIRLSLLTIIIALTYQTGPDDPDLRLKIQDSR